jgi:hypothetical protein
VLSRGVARPSLELALEWGLYWAWKKFYKATEVHVRCCSVAHGQWVAGCPRLHQMHSDNGVSRVGCMGSACGHLPDLCPVTHKIN